MPSIRFFHDAVVHFLVSEAGLNYGALAKGLLLFHASRGRPPRTALEEHLRSGAVCFADADGMLRVHATVSPQHRQLFDDLVSSLVPTLQRDLGVATQVSFSEQHPSTDMLSLVDGKVARDTAGNLILRPGGHGALLNNLDALATRGADLVFVRNVDNVPHADRFAAKADRWIRVLGGKLVELQDAVRTNTRLLSARRPDLDSVEEFVRAELPGAARQLAARNAPARERRAKLQAALDRPLRVCGMVKNTGEPGGGPFWVRDHRGETSPQIVETIEVNRDDRRQQAVLAGGTHFNPVMLALAVRSADGQPYALSRFVDQKRYMRTEKMIAGHPAVVIERPGLWNGSMAWWNAQFVEVPADTFAPAKTVLDLLGPAHQPPYGSR